MSRRGAKTKRKADNMKQNRVHHGLLSRVKAVACEAIVFPTQPVLPDRAKPCVVPWLAAKQERRRNGFTLIELAVVLATLALLAAMLLPALAQTRQNSQVIECLANERQLSTAALMFANDNSDSLVPIGSLAWQPASFAGNPLNNPQLQPGGALAQFCPGNLQSAPMTAGQYFDNWIRAGLLYPYIQSIAIYKCPADLSRCPYGANPSFAKDSDRTYSANCYMGGLNWWNHNYKLYRKQTDLHSPGPDGIWYFIEENPASIDDCYFAMDPDRPDLWYNSPAVLHGFSSMISYGDGHVQVHKWTDANMISDKNPANPPGCNVKADPTSSDLAWFFTVTTIHN
jgi:prepilin-type N-terminal cleavage/methylation domain-containing protein/prepilin-type processing-associated H-X9-DG protein